SGFIISIARKSEFNNKFESNFVLKAIRVINTSDKPVQITKYTFDLKIKDKIQQVILYEEDMIRDRITSLSKFVDRFLKERKGLGEIFRKGNIQKTIGTKYFWDKNQLSTKLILEPGQETGFLSEHFRLAASEPIDELVVTVHYVQHNEERAEQVNIPIIQYENKNKYIFPVKGTWCVIYTWDDPIYNHRDAWSQEFAFDLIQLDSNLQLMDKEKEPNEKSPCYGKEILAIADGDVVGCYNNFPENPASGILMTRDQIKESAEKHGFIPVGSGNYVILQHAKGESSFYAHLIPGSLTVKKGDRVKQGQVLGKVGNTGNSDGPHLHFQLMDGPSHLTGKGLPCQFTNIKNFFGETVKIVDQSSSIIHTFDQF
ncbi:MAG: M23 family metallopeptidase, partial [Candidatus Hodarchaeales archaeon]